MPAKLPNSIARLLEGKTLAPLLRHAERLRNVARILHHLLPPSLQDHCQVVNLRDGVLHLGVDSPAWASRLRFQIPKILKELGAYPGLGINALRVRVVPAGRSLSKPASRPRLSPQSARLLRQTATGLSDPRLRAALLKLASRGEKSEG
jgi:hypothetical protein